VEGTATVDTTGWLEVVVNGHLIHSKKNGMGYVDTKPKIQKILSAVAHAIDHPEEKKEEEDMDEEGDEDEDGDGDGKAEVKQRKKRKDKTKKTEMEFGNKSYSESNGDSMSMSITVGIVGFLLVIGALTYFFLKK